MRPFFTRFIEIVINPDWFFERAEDEDGWLLPLTHFGMLVVWLSLATVLAWALGVRADSPLNVALLAQRVVFTYWQDVLLPGMGAASYAVTVLLLALALVMTAIVLTPLLYLWMRYTGGSDERGGLRRAFQAVAYGLTPVAFGGFVPGLALGLGVYALVLMLYTGPAILLRNRSVFGYAPVLFALVLTILQVW